MFTALVIFASAMAFTPGPNNVMVTASGVNFRIPTHAAAYSDS